MYWLLTCYLVNGRLGLNTMLSDSKFRSLIIVLWKESLSWRKKKKISVCPKVVRRVLVKRVMFLAFQAFQSTGILHFFHKGRLFSALSMGFVWFFPGVRWSQWWLQVSATIHSANSPALADFKPPSWRHWPWSWEEMCPGEPVLATPAMDETGAIQAFCNSLFFLKPSSALQSNLANYPRQWTKPVRMGLFLKTTSKRGTILEWWAGISSQEFLGSFTSNQPLWYRHQIPIPQCGILLVCNQGGGQYFRAG